MLVSVQPTRLLAKSLTVNVGSGRPAGSLPVVKVPVALPEPCAFVEIALI
jgi:hypothetical protein